MLAARPRRPWRPIPGVIAPGDARACASSPISPVVGSKQIVVSIVLARLLMSMVARRADEPGCSRPVPPSP